MHVLFALLCLFLFLFLLLLSCLVSNKTFEPSEVRDWTRVRLSSLENDDRISRLILKLGMSSLGSSTRPCAVSPLRHLGSHIYKQIRPRGRWAL